MNIIEALEAALADGKTHVCYETRDPKPIEEELTRMGAYRDSYGIQLTDCYEYQDEVILGPGRMAFICTTLDDLAMDEFCGLVPCEMCDGE